MRVLQAFRLTSLLLAVSGAGLASGGLAWAFGHRDLAGGCWAVAGAIVFVPMLVSLVRDLLRRVAGVDVIAVLAMAGALVMGEYFAGAVLALMVASGRALEEYAANRAERELSSLLKRAPRMARRLEGTTVTTIPADEVAVGDTLVIGGGDVVPADGVVVQGSASLDESALTGESRLVAHGAGSYVRSGAVNAEATFHLRATATAAESTYAGIVRMVQEAQKSKAPLVRLADRYARIFVPVTLVVAGFGWAISGSAVRALAVLVVATPCPLLLAAPIAIISGVSRAAKRGIVVKGGAAIETLGRARALYLDKTGTITMGAPQLQRVQLLDRRVHEDELLRLAASLDQLSSHVLAAGLVRAAQERSLVLELPADVEEVAGSGIEGTVAGRRVRLGNLAWARGSEVANPATEEFRRRVMREGGSAIFAALDATLMGAFVFDDPIRPDAPRALRMLKVLGLTEVVMLTGDNASVASSVGAAVGVDHVLSELAPADKVAAVRESQARRVTLMVGDGINDAPALAAADIGIAMGARGATSSSEAADVVLVVDRLDRLVEAVQIAQRSRAIALQSIFFGMGLSFVAMGVATFGFLPPVVGAVAQEGIDVVAILNALRALRGPRPGGSGWAMPADMSASLRAEHQGLLPVVERLRELGDRMDEIEPKALVCELRTAGVAVAAILDHERSDETKVYPELSSRLAGDDPLAAMSRTHQEIFRLGRAFGRQVEELSPEGPEAEDIVDLRRTLYALHTVLRLNIAQEEELYQLLGRE